MLFSKEDNPKSTSVSMPFLPAVYARQRWIRVSVPSYNPPSYEKTDIFLFAFFCPAPLLLTTHAQRKRSSGVHAATCWT